MWFRISLIVFFAVASSAVSAERKVVDLSSSTEDRFSIFQVKKDRLAQCNLIATALKISSLDKRFLSLIEGKSQEDRLFYILTSLLGTEAIAKYKISSDKDICFLFIPTDEKNMPLVVFKIRAGELSKVAARDFGDMDNSKLIEEKNTSHASIYPLIEIFKRAEAYLPNDFNKSGQFNKIIFDKKLTSRYRAFLDNYQFPGLWVENKVEDAFSRASRLAEYEKAQRETERIAQQRSETARSNVATRASVTFFQAQNSAKRGQDQWYSVGCSDGSNGTAHETNYGNKDIGSYCGMGRNGGDCKPKHMWSIQLAAEKACSG